MTQGLVVCFKLTWLLPGPVTVALRWGRKTRNPWGLGFQAICLDELAGDVMAWLGGAAGSAPQVQHQRPSPGKMHTCTVNIACQHERWWHNG